ncbi:MAG: BF3164 family lipoprotein [Phocaeicola sp.]|uniref:BF3164 family lipoprotein n=1 Tax=Phocaeicola TaxID=909656 RepID=UPI00234F994E|nr:BF3164 family lipoprotein [Phocaeicola oris]MCE2617502.1 TolB-like 6-bladed beta-propeller domain-containing protein [Phocaeicola oris]
MKKKIFSIVALIAFTCICSCSHIKTFKDAKTFDFSDFKETKDLKGTTLEFDSIIMRPSLILTHDSILLTIEYNREKLVNLYNLRTKKMVGEKITHGQGPDDMLIPKFMNSNDSLLLIYDVGTSTVFEYAWLDFINDPNPTPLNKVKLDTRIFFGLQKISNHYIGNNYIKSNRFTLFDKNGKNIKEFIAYPYAPYAMTNVEKREAYSTSLLSNGIDKIALFYNVTDLIEIYDINGNLQKRLHGPKHYLPHFKEHNDGTISKALAEKGNFDTYFSPIDWGDKIMALFQDTPYDETNPNITPKLMTFSWKGKPLTVYNLDCSIFTFCINKKTNKLYGISNNPEFHIVEFNL